MEKKNIDAVKREIEVEKDVDIDNLKQRMEFVNSCLQGYVIKPNKIELKDHMLIVTEPYTQSISSIRLKLT